jgi:cation transport regulator ChaC
MTFDTQTLNKQRQNFDNYDEIWVFGYGSLIYKVDFEFIESINGYIEGYARRFWQGSHDHRGTPEKPGRVLTLTPVPNARCFGRAFKVNHDVFDHLDHREKNGYLREEIPLLLDDGRQVLGLIYIANPDNAAYLGKASIDSIARQIAASHGPSGPNKDYVFELAAALRQHNEVDEHVFAIENAIIKLECER